YQTPELIRKTYDLQIATKGILLNATTKTKNAILSSRDKKLIKLYETWLDQKEELARFYTYTKAEIKEEKINLDSLEKATEATEKKLSLSSNLFVADQKELTYKQVAAALKPNEAAVEIINFQKHNHFLTDTSLYAAIVVRNGAAPKYIEIPNSQELDKKYYSYYKNTIISRSQDKYSYQKYWASIDSSLKGKTDIYVSVDGIYNLINLNTLRLPNNEYLIDRYNLHYVLNTKTVVLKKPTPAPVEKVAVLFGNPAYGNGEIIASLPGTKIEVDKASQHLKANGFKTKVYTQEYASEANIKAVKSPYILHIATHGFFQPDASTSDHEGLDFGMASQRAEENALLRGGLLLAGAEKSLNNADSLEVKSADDGVFTAYEAMNMNLEKTEIVFLSACETGKGETKAGEGVYGLQRAIQVAGAESVVMSLWKVSDEATQHLLNIFYKEWFKTKNKSLSMIKAQKELKKKFPEPIFWGAFIII
ncbi:MAG TPA: CHAT domain-containing protein, partial [Cytophagales bacterium]|nr:CHAT domain-containing protein [Cytophagales bacterium]